jgi:hypothetical protein
MRAPLKKSFNNVFMDYNDAPPDTKEFSQPPPIRVSYQAI